MEFLGKATPGDRARQSLAHPLFQMKYSNAWPIQMNQNTWPNQMSGVKGRSGGNTPFAQLTPNALGGALLQGLLILAIGWWWFVWAFTSNKKNYRAWGRLGLGVGVVDRPAFD